MNQTVALVLQLVTEEREIDKVRAAKHDELMTACRHAHADGYAIEFLAGVTGYHRNTVSSWCR